VNLKQGGLTKLFRPEYDAYKHAKRRCENPRDKDYPKYGALGVQFKFTSFKQLLDEIGPRLDGTSLDRVNTVGHYEPGNIRWATPTEQVQNSTPKGHCRICGAKKVCPTCD
jgi:hypothetical protein